MTNMKNSNQISKMESTALGINSVGCRIPKLPKVNGIHLF